MINILNINIDDLILCTMKYFMVDSEEINNLLIIKGINEIKDISKPHHTIIQLFDLMVIKIPILIVI